MKDNMKSLKREALLKDYEDIQFQILIHDFSVQEADEYLLEDETQRIPLSKENMKDFTRIFKRAQRHVRTTETMRRFPKILNRAAVVMFICFAVLSVSVISVQAIRVDVLNFLIQMQSEYTSIRLDSKSNPVIGDSITVPWADTYAPTYFPKGYRIIRLQHYERARAIDLENEDGALIQYYDYTSASSANIDTEDADEIVEISINGHPGLLVRKDGRTTFAWAMDDHMFIIYAQLSDDGIMQIAESIKFIK